MKKIIIFHLKMKKLFFLLKLKKMKMKLMNLFLKIMKKN